MIVSFVSTLNGYGKQERAVTMRKKLPHPLYINFIKQAFFAEWRRFIDQHLRQYSRANEANSSAIIQ